MWENHHVQPYYFLLAFTYLMMGDWEPKKKREKAAFGNGCYGERLLGVKKQQICYMLQIQKVGHDACMYVQT